jgi:integrase
MTPPPHDPTAPQPKDDALAVREGAPGALRAPPAADLALPEHLRDAARAAVEGAWAPRTQAEYQRRWLDFRRWCSEVGRQDCPATPATVAAYLLERAPGWSLAALQQAHAAIGWAHTLAGVDPTPAASREVRTVMKGLRREKGTRPVNAKRPITLDQLAALVARIDRASLQGKRDAAILLTGWNAALRRSEIVGIDREHLSDQPGGAGVLIPRSKTDQEGQGVVVGVPQRDDDPTLCPVRALAEWLKASGITAGPLFRPLTRHGTLRTTRLTPASVADIVKRYAGAAGLPPEPFGGHSLRAGLVTESYRQGVPEAQIMSTTRHTSATMLARYRREADPVKQGAASALTRKPRKP